MRETRRGRAAVVRERALARAVRGGAALADLGRALRELLLPPACGGCGGPGPAAGLPLCRVCAARLPPALEADPPAPRPLATLAAAVPYEDGWEEWLHRFKYAAPGLAALDPAAEAVARSLILEAARRVAGPPPDAVVPVPLHPTRLRARGFHPPALLAAALARARGLPLRPSALQRIRDTPSQTGLSRAQRRRNVAGAFRARAPAPRRVWLVDDVVTTGATLAAAARALRAAGAREVAGIACARTPGLAGARTPMPPG